MSQAAASAAGTTRPEFAGYFAWTGGGKFASEFLRLGANLILTRLLAEEAFGLILLVNTFIQGLATFSDVGINASIIQNRAGGDRRFLNTAWTVQILRGTLLWIVCWAAASMVASFYEQPELAVLIPVAGLATLLASFNSPALAMLQRRLQVRKWVLVDLSAQVVAVIVMIVVALITHSVWALIAGSISMSAVRLAISHGLGEAERPRIGWDRAAFMSMLGFGVWILINTPIGWIADNADRLTLARIVPLSVVGVYYIALMIGNLPYRFLVAIGSNAVFPLFSRARNEGVDLASVYREVQAPLLVLGGSVIAGLIATAGPAIEIILEPRWYAAIAMLLPIVAGQWFRILSIPSANAVFALGWPQWLVLGNGMKVIGYLCFVPVGLSLGRLYDAPALGALWGFAAGEALAPITYRIALARSGLDVGWAELGSCLRVALSLVLTALLGSVLESHGVSAWLRGVAALAVVTPLWLRPFVTTARPLLAGRLGGGAA